MPSWPVVMFCPWEMKQSRRSTNCLTGPTRLEEGENCLSSYPPTESCLIPVQFSFRISSAMLLDFLSYVGSCFPPLSPCLYSLSPPPPSCPFFCLFVSMCFFLSVLFLFLPGFFCLWTKLTPSSSTELRLVWPLIYFLFRALWLWHLLWSSPTTRNNRVGSTEDQCDSARNSTQAFSLALKHARPVQAVCGLYFTLSDVRVCVCARARTHACVHHLVSCFIYCRDRLEKKLLPRAFYKLHCLRVCKS